MIPANGGVVPFTNPTAEVNMALDDSAFVAALPGIYHYTVVLPTAATFGVIGGSIQPARDEVPLAPRGNVTFLGTTIVLDGYVTLAAGQRLTFVNTSGFVVSVALGATITATVERVQAL